MKQIITNAFIFILLTAPIAVFGQLPCTVTNSSGCFCPDLSDTCELLPDISVSWSALTSYLAGPTEYSQTGNGSNNGRLRVTSSTPNTGHGPFTVRGTDYFVCGTDTIYSPGGLAQCPDGSTPSNLLHQRVYTKNNGVMTYVDRWAGQQTYHPTHGHNHVDDWVVMTLRVEDPLEPDTLNWPIIGTGSKLGFCLMDFGSCQFYTGHCRDNNTLLNQGNILDQTNIINFGLGGGSYGCSPVEQGISVGYTDIYSENLDGMWIDVPPGTCNGDYWIVVEADFNNNFLESNEDNNWTAIPFTLTQQVPSGSQTASISVAGATTVCEGQSLDLSASPTGTGLTYAWSNGGSTESISITQPGTYRVTVSSSCGTAISDSVVVTPGLAPPTSSPVNLCNPGTATLTASGTGQLSWFDAAVGGNLLGTGNVFNTPVVNNSTTYYVEDSVSIIGPAHAVGPVDNTIGAGGYYSGDQHLKFDAFAPFVLESVKVYANGDKNRTVELRDNNGNILDTETVFMTTGMNIVNLNFTVYPGTDYQLGWAPGSLPNLYRNNGGVSYPYSVAGVASITTTSVGSNYFYFYYDWQIKEPDQNCRSARQAVPVSIAAEPVIYVDSLELSTDNASSYLWHYNGNPIPGATGQMYLVTLDGYYQVSIVDGNGCALISDSMFINSGTAPTCEAPQNTNSDIIDYRTVHLSWIPLINATAYELRGRATLNANWTTLVINGGSTASFDVFDLNPTLTFIWQIRAVCDTNSDWSDSDTFSIMNDFTCNEPSPAFTSNVTASSATLNWASTEGALGYELQGGLAGGTYINFLIAAPDTVFNVITLASGQSYEWKVRAICDPTGTMLSTFSPLQTFTTLNANKSIANTTAVNVIPEPMKVYPNPFTDYALVKIPVENIADGNYTLKVLDAKGQVIQSIESLKQNTVTISRNELSAGVYFVEVSGDKMFRSKLMVK